MSRYWFTYSGWNLKRIVFFFYLTCYSFSKWNCFFVFIGPVQFLWKNMDFCFIISASLCVLLKGVHTTGLQDSDGRESAACPSLYNHAHFVSDELRPFIQLRPQGILRKEQTSCPTNGRQHVVTFKRHQNVHFWQQQQKVRWISRIWIRFGHFRFLAV